MPPRGSTDSGEGRGHDSHSNQAQNHDQNQQEVQAQLSPWIAFDGQLQIQQPPEVHREIHDETASQDLREPRMA